MNKYYCAPLYIYIMLLFQNKESYFMVFFVELDTGSIVLGITIPFPTGKRNCAYVNTSSYPWLYRFLLENGIAFPTYRHLIKDKKIYEEFKFRKEK